MSTATKTQDELAAFHWGEGIGRVSFYNNEHIGDAKGTGLRGKERKAFESGLVAGYEAAKAKNNAPATTGVQSDVEAANARRR